MTDDARTVPSPSVTSRYETAPSEPVIPRPERSLIDDIEELVDDARTYVEAELDYQKTRVTFVLDRLKKTIAFGVGAAIVGLLAAIGLTVGLIIAFAALIGGFAATALVVGVMLLVVYLLLKKAAANWKTMMGVVRSGDPDARPGTQENRD